jgi:hypothetical protein
VNGPEERILGAVRDLDGNRIPVGVCDGTVVVHGCRMDRDQAEEFGRLFVLACWDAEGSREAVAEEVPAAEPVTISLICGHATQAPPDEAHVTLFWCAECRQLRLKIAGGP